MLGVVENMSIHICSNCGHEEHIFGSGGGQKMCDEYGADFLGSLPLNMQIRSDADDGKPTVVADLMVALPQTFVTLHGESQPSFRAKPRTTHKRSQVSSSRTISFSARNATVGGFLREH